MIIVLEGSDCTGKTTLANKLSEITGFEIVKGSSFEISELGADGMFEYMMSLLDKKNIIIDRFFYSNLVYGKLYSYPMMKSLQYALLAEKLNKNALLVYLHAPDFVVKNRMKVRGDDMINLNDINGILKEYEKVMSGTFRAKFQLSVDTWISDMNLFSHSVKELIEQDTFKSLIKIG